MARAIGTPLERVLDRHGLAGANELDLDFARHRIDTADASEIELDEAVATRRRPLVCLECHDEGGITAR